MRLLRIAVRVERTLCPLRLATALKLDQGILDDFVDLNVYFVELNVDDGSSIGGQIS